MPQVHSSIFSSACCGVLVGADSDLRRRPDLRRAKCSSPRRSPAGSNAKPAFACFSAARDRSRPALDRRSGADSTVAATADSTAPCTRSCSPAAAATARTHAYITRRLSEGKTDETPSASSSATSPATSTEPWRHHTNSLTNIEASPSCKRRGPNGKGLLTPAPWNVQAALSCSISLPSPSTVASWATGSCGSIIRIANNPPAAATAART